MEEPRSSPNGSLGYRVQALERRVERIENLEPAVLAKSIKDLESDLRDLRGDMRGLRRALWTLAASLLVSALTLTVTVIQVWGV